MQFMESPFFSAPEYQFIILFKEIARYYAKKTDCIWYLKIFIPCHNGRNTIKSKKHFLDKFVNKMSFCPNRGLWFRV